MKKVLIISYFFPPCTYTASQRISGWVKHLHTLGYYPVVITRNWDITLKSMTDSTLPSGDEVYIDKNEFREIHYIPYKGNLRDRMISKYTGSAWFAYLSKFLTATEILLQPFINAIIPSVSLYKYACKIIIVQKISDFKAIVVSGNPFIQFKFGFLLKRKYNIPWIADYRDDWTTTELYQHDTLLQKTIHILERWSEKKWVSSASAITSVSHHYVCKISSLTGVKGFVLQNGFEKNYDVHPIVVNDAEFRVLYNGTLYATQEIEIFLGAIKRLLVEYSKKIKIQLLFPGLEMMQEQADRVKKIMTGYEDNVHISGRIAKEEVIKMQKKANVVLMVAHSGIKGVPSSKIYEYLSLRKKILVCPGDHDILDHIVDDTKSGKAVYTEDEAYEFLRNELEKFMQNMTIYPYGDPEKIKSYSAEQQVKVLADIIDKIGQ